MAFPSSTAEHKSSSQFHSPYKVGKDQAHPGKDPGLRGLKLLVLKFVDLVGLARLKSPLALGVCAIWRVKDRS